MKSIHDRPYYKKVYKKDSKNLKILIGHGSKQPKHAKKGSPYTQNPQKRRPVNKLSAPLMALDEAISEDFKTRLNEIKEATFIVKMREKVDPYYITILEKEKNYNGIIKGDNITITDTEKGPITKTKKEFLDKLAEYGELCNVVYCDDSIITIGAKTLTFSEMLKPADTTPEQPKKEGPIATRNKEQGAIVGSIADDVVKGKSIEKSVLDKYGHTAMGRRFAKGFAEAASEALKESGLEGDTLKAAALTSVMMGMVARVPFDVIGTFTGQIPDDLIPEIANTLGPYLSTLAPALEKLQKLWDGAGRAAAKGRELAGKGKKILNKARQAAEKAFESSSGLYVTQAEFWFARFKMGSLKEDQPESWPYIAKFWEEGTGKKDTEAITNGIKYGFLGAVDKKAKDQYNNKLIPQTLFTAENIEKFYNKYGAESLPLTLEEYKRKYTNASNINSTTWWSAAFINYIMRGDGDFQKIVDKSTRGNHRSYWKPAEEKTKSLLNNGKIDQAPWIFITAEQAKKIGWSDNEGIGKIGDIVMVPGVGYEKDNNRIHGDIKTRLGRIGGNSRNSVTRARSEGVALVTKNIEAKLLLVKEYGTEAAKKEIKKYEDSSSTSRANPASDLNLSVKEIREKFKGYKGQDTGFKGYIHFLWDEFDKNKSNPEITGWTKQKTLDLVKERAPKYGIEPYIVMGVMSDESGHKPTGIFGQTRGRAGNPEEAIRANSTAYGMGGVTQETYEAIKNKIGVPHYMIWQPKYGIEAAIAVIKLKLKNNDNDLEKAMNSYAGTTAGGKRKMKAIEDAKKQYEDV